MNNAVNQINILTPVYQPSKNSTYPVILNSDNINLKIKDFYQVEDKLFLSIEISELEYDNISIGVSGNKLILSVAIEKKYNLSKLPRELITGDPLKIHSSYFIMRRAEILIPGEKISLLRTFNFPDDKEVQLLLNQY